MMLHAVHQLLPLTTWEQNTFPFLPQQLFRINCLLLVHTPPLSDTDVLDHPGLNTSILESLTSLTFIQITTIHVFLQSSTSSTFVQITTIHVFLQLPQKGSPWDTEFRCPLVMPDLLQCLCSRVPPPHSAPALYNDDVSWYRLWVPPCTLLRVLFERSCTYTMNTCISHVFDMVTIYSICILNILMIYLCMMAIQMHLLVEVLVVGEIPP